MTSSKSFLSFRNKCVIMILSFLILHTNQAVSQQKLLPPHPNIHPGEKFSPPPVSPSLTITSLNPSVPVAYKQLAVNFSFYNYDTARKTRTGSIHGKVISALTGRVAQNADEVFKINNMAPGATMNGTLFFRSLELGPDEKVVLQYDDAGDSMQANVYRPYNASERFVRKTPVTSSQALAFTDNDKDSIDDNMEHALLSRFRPYYMFSKGGGAENFAPTDADWYVRRAVLLADGKDDPYTPNQVLSSNPSSILAPPRYVKKVEVNGPPVPEDLFATRSQTLNDIHLSVIGHYSHANGLIISPEDNGNIHGTPWQNVRGDKNIVLNGFYGHVVPIRLQDPDDFSFYDARNKHTGNVYYKIEYWQFFAFNSDGKAGNFGDHEGDWCSVQILYDPLNNKIISVFNFAHGFCFAYHLDKTVSTVPGSNTDGAILEYQGFNYTTNIDLVAHNVTHLAHHVSDSLKAQDNILRMFQDPDTKEFAHPVVYIEHGSHEFYPSQFWDYYAAPNHNGDDAAHTFLTPAPPNLGEVEFPLSETSSAGIVLRYNGYWGAYNHDNTPPMGPALHQQFTWPGTSSIRWLLPASLGF